MHSGQTHFHCTCLVPACHLDLAGLADEPGREVRLVEAAEVGGRRGARRQQPRGRALGRLELVAVQGDHLEMEETRRS